MTLPLSTTTVRIERPPAEALNVDPWGEGYDDPPQAPEGQREVVAEGVRAVIAPSSANGSNRGGQGEAVEFRLTVDPSDLTYLDVVVDETTGITYLVRWAQPVAGPLDLDHVAAGIYYTKGQTP